MLRRGFRSSLTTYFGVVFDPTDDAAVNYICAPRPVSGIFNWSDEALERLGKINFSGDGSLRAKQLHATGYLFELFYDRSSRLPTTSRAAQALRHAWVSLETLSKPIIMELGNTNQRATPHYHTNADQRELIIWACLTRYFKQVETTDPAFAVVFFGDLLSERSTVNHTEPHGFYRTLNPAPPTSTRPCRGGLRRCCHWN